MISELNETPKALRLHIGVFGSANSGKSTLINTIFGQNVSLVSEIAGTTTDPVFKPMELMPLGPVVFIDTAGFDDETALGEKRIEKTLEQLDLCDCAILVFSKSASSYDAIKKQINIIKEKKIPIILAQNIIEGAFECNTDSDFGLPIISVDFSDKHEIEKIKNEIISALIEKTEDTSLTGNLVQNGDVVMLVMPQDIAAPKGRLILPQVQTTRDLLDNKCVVLSTSSDTLSSAISALSKKPDLVITDSQVFKAVAAVIGDSIKLTSFSVLMAKSKADIKGLIDGAKAIDELKEGDKVAIIESCSHQTLDGDIATVKIPKLLLKYTNKNLNIVSLRGNYDKSELDDIKLAIHCGACMITRRAMFVKQHYFAENNIPLTNFGIAIAYMNGILDRVCY